MAADGGANGDYAIKKNLILNAFVESCATCIVLAHSSHTDLRSGSGHQSPGLWQHPDDQSARFNDVDHWMELARLLERGKFHGIFIADVLGAEMSFRVFVSA